MSRPQKYPPSDWRERLPDPFHYYREHVKELGEPGISGVAQGKCPFHEDDPAVSSVNLISVNLISGHWHCPCCGRGAMTVYHQRLTGMTWGEAVCDLVEGAAA